MLNYLFPMPSQFFFFIYSLSLVPLSASQGVKMLTREAPRCTFLESFFTLPPLHTMPRDLRKKLIPLSFCAAVVRHPVREVFSDEGNGFIGAIEFGSKGTHLAYGQKETCTIMNVETGKKLSGGLLGVLWHHIIASIAFNEDDSKIAYISVNGLTSMERSLKNYSADFKDRVVVDNTKNQLEDFSREQNPSIAYTSQDQMVAIKISREVILMDHGTREFFCDSSTPCVANDDGRRNAIACCLKRNVAAFARSDGSIVLFSCGANRWDDFLVSHSTDKVVTLCLNIEGTFLLVLYDTLEGAYRIDVYDTKTKKLCYDFYLSTHYGDIASVSFTHDSQGALILTPHNTVHYHISTGTFVALYEGRYGKDEEHSEATYSTFIKQAVSPVGLLFARCNPQAIELYALHPLEGLVGDTDVDGLGLERLLFVQFMRVITQWGISLTREGFGVTPKVLAWGRQSPILFCAELNKKCSGVIKELEPVYKSFSEMHRSYLKKLYDLPDLPWT